MYRRFLVGMILCGMVLSAVVFAETDPVATPKIRDIQKGNRGINAIQTLNVEGSGRIRGDLVVDGSVSGASLSGSILTLLTARADTNASTSVTTYTPRYVGDTLIGKTGGTNNVWIAGDATTNGWLRFDSP